MYKFKMAADIIILYTWNKTFLSDLFDERVLIYCWKKKHLIHYTYSNVDEFYILIATFTVTKNRWIKMYRCANGEFKIDMKEDFTSI